MIWIDLENKLPTDADIPGWEPWTQAQWDAWLAESQHFVNELAALNGAGQLKERNELIDARSAHWGALKPWLLALSGGKCWFSEARELYSHYDVEHFRPKKEAKTLGEPTRDGYWWLAFNYMNFRICGNVGNRKKGGWFPLHERSLCSTYAHQCEEAETPYMLDPINSEDVALLAFDEEGKVIAMPNCSEWDKERVEESLKRLKLNEHSVLAEERRKIWQKVDRLIFKYLSAKARCMNGPNPAAVQILKEVRAQIREMTDPTAELSSVAKWCVLFRSNPQLSRLVA